ncbi:MAG: Hpt domain-containing protein [Gemmatimonadaceae bacterium]
MRGDDAPREAGQAREAAGGGAGDGGGDVAGDALARLRRFGGDALVRDMSEILLSDVPERIRAARAGLRAGDRAAVRLATHAMKSSCAQFGAAAVARLCGDAEAAARRGELAPLPALLDAIEREFARFRRWLDGEIAGAGERA